MIGIRTTGSVVATSTHRAGTLLNAMTSVAPAATHDAKIMERHARSVTRRSPTDQQAAARAAPRDESPQQV
jgi:hypothetical protein